MNRVVVAEVYHVSTRHLSRFGSNVTSSAEHERGGRSREFTVSLSQFDYGIDDGKQGSGWHLRSSSSLTNHLNGGIGLSNISSEPDSAVHWHFRTSLQRPVVVSRGASTARARLNSATVWTISKAIRKSLRSDTLRSLSRSPPHITAF